MWESTFFIFREAKTGQERERVCECVCVCKFLAGSGGWRDYLLMAIVFSMNCEVQSSAESLEGSGERFDGSRRLKI